MQKLINGVSFTLIILTLILAGCNTSIEPGDEEENITPAESDYVVDISTGDNLWDAENTVISPENEGDPVVIQYAASDWPAWGINLYTGEEGTAGMDLSGYGSIEIVWEAGYPKETEEGDESAPNKQIKFTLRCGGTGDSNEVALAGSTYISLEAKKTTTIPLKVDTTLTLAKKRNVQQLIFQAKVNGTELKIYSITFKPLTDLSFQIHTGESYVSVAGNRITFLTGNKNDNHSVNYTFPKNVNLTGKTVTIEYELEDWDEAIERQLIIQPTIAPPLSQNDGIVTANNNKNGGANGQLYGAVGYAGVVGKEDFETFASGSFTLNGDKLLDLGNANESANGGPFTANGFRFSNNPGTWDESGVGTHTRQSEYTIIINKISVE